jgi:disulfide bond formation protein DsbB
MTPLVQNFSLIIAVLVMLGQLFSVVLILCLIFRQKLILKYISKYAAPVIILISGTAVFGSLFYSDYAMYNPCKLCWYQRIAIYPQFLIALLAFIFKDKKFTTYTLGLSAIGFCIGVYQYLGQMGVTSLNCSAVGQSLGCSERFVIVFGYITIPMMAITTCLMIFLVSLATKTTKN